MMNGHGIVYSPPGEVIEANFSNGKLNDGKIKILVSPADIISVV